MADLKYYVSQQRGNDDTGDGLTPDTAWATIRKAMTTVAPNPEGDVYVYIGPGVYRETTTTVPSNNGIDRDHRIIYVGDPDALYVTGDNPGILRWTDSNSNETASGTITYFLDLSSSSFIELWNLRIESSATTSVIHGNANTDSGLVCKELKLWAFNSNGINYFTCYNCTVWAKTTAFQYVTAYNCICIGCLTAGFSNSVCYNCLAIASSKSFVTCTSYNCESFCCRGVTSGTAYNCAAGLDFSSSFPSGWSTYLTFDSPSSPIVGKNIDFTNIVRLGLADWGNDIGSPIDILGIPRVSGFYDVGPWELPDYSLEYSDVYQTPPAIKLYGANQMIFDFAVKAGVPITKSIYVKWITPSDVKLNPNMTGATTPAGFAANASSTNGTNYPYMAFDGNTSSSWRANGAPPQWLSLEFPDESYVVNKYYLTVRNSVSYNTYMPKSWTLEGWNGTDWVILDTQTDISDWALGEKREFNLSNSVGYKTYRLNVTAYNNASNILFITECELWGYRDITQYSKPQIIVRGLGMPDQVESCTAPRNTWQHLQISVTPQKSGVMKLVLSSRSTTTGSYSIFSDPL